MTGSDRQQGAGVPQGGQEAMADSILQQGAGVLQDGQEAMAGSLQEASTARSLRIGQGYDVHAFAEGRKLIIGGVDIPHERGLAGHSDADVLAHAIADALLGGIRAGDIGKLFPDDDPQWEGANSLELLAAVAQKVREEGFEIVDVDSVIIAQAPKMAPYREQMRANLAKAMGIAVDNVGVKATTTEHLGFEGRGEGISATAVCLLARCS